MAGKYTTHYTPEAEEDLRYWHKQDKKTLKRILKLIENMLETPFSGLGKPEPGDSNFPVAGLTVLTLLTA